MPGSNYRDTQRQFMNDGYRQQIMHTFPSVIKVIFRTRGTKQYCTVEFDEPRLNKGYDFLHLLLQYMREHQYPNARITSGGPSGGTFRLNPD